MDSLGPHTDWSESIVKLHTRGLMPVTRSARRLSKQSLTPYLFIAPFFLAFALFTIGPLIIAAVNSVFTQRLIGGRTFTGIDNYSRVFSDAIFWESVRTIMLFGVVFMPFTIILSLVLVLIVDTLRSARVSLFYRGLYFLPYTVPAVLATLMWGFLYGPSISPFRDAASWFGIDSFNLLAPDIVLFSIGNIYVWAWVGYNIMIYFAALRAISPELYEAAALDGANAWRQAWHIKVPLMKPVLTVSIMFSIIGTLQLVTEPLVLRPLQPRSIGEGHTPNMYAYWLVTAGADPGYVAALSFVLGLMIVVISIGYIVLSNGRKGGAEE